MRGRRRGTVAVLAVAVVLLAVTAVVLLGRSTDGGGTASSVGPVPSRAIAPVPAGDAAAGVGAGAEPAPVQDDPLPVALADRQVARTATLSVAVEDADAAARRARLLGPQFGGYVESESSSDADATLTLRVASDSLDDALTALADLGSVVDRQVSTDDVTEQSVDVAARIESQRAGVERVRALLAQAASVGEVVQVEGELVTRVADLRSLEQRAAALADAVSLSTVTVTLSEPSDGASTGPDDTGFLARARRGVGGVRRRAAGAAHSARSGAAVRARAGRAGAGGRAVVASAAARHDPRRGRLTKGPARVTIGRLRHCERPRSL